MKKILLILSVFFVIMVMFLTVNLSTSYAQTCTGSLSLTLKPRGVEFGGSVTMIISGLSNCDGKTVYLAKDYCYPAAPLVSSCVVYGSGCKATFSAPASKGDYLYVACFDMDNDGIAGNDPGEFDDATLTVSWGKYDYNRDDLSLCVNFVNIPNLTMVDVYCCGYKPAGYEEVADCAGGGPICGGGCGGRVQKIIDIFNNQSITDKRKALEMARYEYSPYTRMFCNDEIRKGELGELYEEGRMYGDEEINAIMKALPRFCNDTDGGKVYTVKGIVSWFNDLNEQVETYPDFCQDSRYLIECYCIGTHGLCDPPYDCYNLGSNYYCSGGRCIKGGGGCPTLFVYNGKSYVEIRKSNLHSQRGIDTVDDILLNELTVVDGNYLLQLRETTLPEHSYIDSVKLYAVDKEEMKELKLISAKHSRLGDVTSILSNSDDIRTDTKVFDNIELKFAALAGDYYLFEIEGYNPWWHFVKMDIAQISIIAVVVAVIVVAVIFSIFKFLAKKK